MTIATRSTSLLLALSLPLLGACQPSPPPEPPASPAPPAGSTATSAPQTALGRTVEKAINEAREELRTENISIGDGVHIKVNGREVRRTDNLPKAEITPQGDLLVEDKPVTVSAEQRAMLLDYRNHVIAIAEAGMAIGVKGADLAGKAISETIGGLIAGDTSQIEQRIEAEAGKLEADVLQLCAQLPPMLATQQELAATLPEFAPYATMTQDDIDDCADEVKEG